MAFVEFALTRSSPWHLFDSKGFAESVTQVTLTRELPRTMPCMRSTTRGTLRQSKKVTPVMREKSERSIRAQLREREERERENGRGKNMIHKGAEKGVGDVRKERVFILFYFSNIYIYQSEGFRRKMNKKKNEEVTGAKMIKVQR